MLGDGLGLGAAVAVGVGVGLGLALLEALAEGEGLVEGELVGLAEGEGLAVTTGRLGAAVEGLVGPPPKGAGAVGLVAAKATTSPAKAARANPTGKKTAAERDSSTSPPLF